MVGGRGGTHMCNYDVISGWQVWHLLIVHLNSFDLLCEMNGYAIYSPIEFQKQLFLENFSNRKLKYLCVYILNFKNNCF